MTLCPRERSKSPTAFFMVKPAWSEPITIFIEDSLSQKGFGRSDDVVRGKAEFLQQIFERSRGAERAHADGFSFGADVTIPAKDRSHFDGNTSSDAGRQDTFPVSSVLL